MEINLLNYWFKKYLLCLKTTDLKSISSPSENLQLGDTGIQTPYFSALLLQKYISAWSPLLLQETYFVVTSLSGSFQISKFF